MAITTEVAELTDLGTTTPTIEMKSTEQTNSVITKMNNDGDMQVEESKISITRVPVKHVPLAVSLQHSNEVYSTHQQSVCLDHAVAPVCYYFRDDPKCGFEMKPMEIIEQQLPKRLHRGIVNLHCY